MEVEIKKWTKRFGIATATGRAYVDGEMAMELDEMYVVVSWCHCVVALICFLHSMHSVIIGNLL